MVEGVILRLEYLSWWKNRRKLVWLGEPINYLQIPYKSHLNWVITKLLCSPRGVMYWAFYDLGTMAKASGILFDRELRRLIQIQNRMYD